jgi:group I intron endonuclease
MFSGIIYKAENKVNGKIYIGKTSKPLVQRIHDHEKSASNGSPFYFHKAIRKYGVSGFLWIPISKHYSEDKLNKMEMYYIKYLGSKIPDGYNSTDGGEGVCGRHFKHTNSWKKRISEIMKISMLGNANSVGCKRTKEWKEKMSKVMAVKMKGSGNPNWHKKQSVETIQKRREALLGVPLSRSHKKKLSKAHKGKHLSMKTREKLSLSLKKSWARRKGIIYANQSNN